MLVFEPESRFTVKELMEKDSWVREGPADLGMMQVSEYHSIMNFHYDRITGTNKDNKIILPVKQATQNNYFYTLPQTN